MRTSLRTPIQRTGKCRFRDVSAERERGRGVSIPIT